MESEDLIAKLSGHRRTFVVYSSTQDARYPNNAYAAAARSKIRDLTTAIHHPAPNSRIDAPLQSYCTQITDICTQIADDVHDEVRPRFECKSGTMGDGWRGNLGRSAAQGSYDSSLSRTPQTQLREHPRSGESTPLSSTLSAISVQTCP